MLRRKRYSKRPSRGKATSIASTSDGYVEENRQQIGAPPSKTMLHEGRASFLASQSSSRLSCRSSMLSERPAKVLIMIAKECPFVLKQKFFLSFFMFSHSFKKETIFQVP